MLKLNHTYQNLPEITSLLVSIESHRATLSLLPHIATEHLDSLKSSSLRSSALYSSKIEGVDATTDLNKLTIKQLESTYAWIANSKKIPVINQSFIKELHKRSQNNLRRDAGHFRTEQSAIFNQAGVAVYLTPPPQDINKLLDIWTSNLEQEDIPIIIRAAVAHFQFEKIHPFLDGNGRVGRLVVAAYLRRHNYDLAGLLPFEKYLEENREIYYDTIGIEGRDITPFIVFFLKALKETGETILKQLSSRTATTTSSLLPRRQELVDIIKDHGPVSLDFLHRRFLAIPASTLRYDLLSLVKAGYIKKLGATRGAMYQIK